MCFSRVSSAPFVVFWIFTGLIVALNHCFTPLADMLLLRVKDTCTKEGLLSPAVVLKDGRVMKLSIFLKKVKTPTNKCTNPKYLTQLVVCLSKYIFLTIIYPINFKLVECITKEKINICYTTCWVQFAHYSTFKNR